MSDKTKETKQALALMPIPAIHDVISTLGDDPSLSPIQAQQLVDCVWRTQAQTAEKWGVGQSAIAMLVSRHRAAYDRLCDLRESMLIGMTEDNIGIALMDINKWLTASTREDLLSVSDGAAMTAIASRLVDIRAKLRQGRTDPVVDAIDITPPADCDLASLQVKPQSISADPATNTQ